MVAGAAKGRGDGSGRGISADVVLPVARVLEELGYADHALERRFENAAVVDGAVADALVDSAARALHDEAIGLTLATRIPIGALGDLDYALCTSADVREGVTRVARYYGVATQRVRLEVEERPPHAALAFHRIEGVRHSRHWIELSLALIAHRLRQTVSGALAFEASFVHEAPTSIDAHAAFFGAPPIFRATLDRLVFPHDLLDAPLRTASATLAETLVRKMERLAPSADDDAFLDRVRRTILVAIEGGRASVQEVARDLHTTPRTLQRELGRRDLSYQTLFDDLRSVRAHELLESGRSVAEVAARIGFSQPSAFFRAYRRWTGTTPRKKEKR